MTLSTFKNRLEQGKANNLVYSRESQTGLVTVWKHEQSFILTWEECPQGMQFDESTYTRDERCVFATLDELLSYISANDLPLQSFAP